MSLQTLYDDYMKNEMRDKSSNTVRLYKYALGQMIGYFGNIESCDVSAKMMKEYRQKMQDDGITNTTINAYFRVISSFFSWLYREEFVSENICKRMRSLKEARKVRDYLTDDECSAVIGASTGQVRLLIVLALFTGMRRDELAKARKSDVYDGRILVHGKGKKERSIVINEYLLPLLEEHLLYKERYEFIFTSRNGSSASPETLRLWIKGALKDAGLGDERIGKLSTHNLRHTAATSLITAGVAIETIQKFLGHSSPNTTRIYAHTVSSTVDEAVLKMKGF
jgi:site-specific recombinase XerD